MLNFFGESTFDLHTTYLSGIKILTKSERKTFFSCIIFLNKTFMYAAKTHLWSVSVSIWLYSLAISVIENFKEPPLPTHIYFTIFGCSVFLNIAIVFTSLSHLPFWFGLYTLITASTFSLYFPIHLPWNLVELLSWKQKKRLNKQ